MNNITTKRLQIVPMTKEELQNYVNKYKDIDDDLSKAYGEMLYGCIKYPDEYLWYTNWKIIKIDGGNIIGSIGFKGFNNGYPEIGYGVEEEYEGKGYATEGVKALCQWAFNQEKVLAVEAETTVDNIVSQKVLLKNGFL